MLTVSAQFGDRQARGGGAKAVSRVAIPEGAIRPDVATPERTTSVKLTVLKGAIVGTRIDATK
jgi:hypothetical protein